MTSITWRLTQPCEGQGRRPRKVIDPEQNSERRELRDVASRSDLGLFAWWPAIRENRRRSRRTN